MIGRRIVTGLWVVVAGLATTTTWRSYKAHERLRMLPGAPGLASVVQIPDGPTMDSLDQASMVATDANPFRRDRSPMDSSAHVAGPLGGTVPGATAVSAAHVKLRGILGGPPWTAVLAGVPGIENAVILRAGDTVAGFSIVRIRRDTVVVRGSGTLYTLTLTLR